MEPAKSTLEQVSGSRRRLRIEVDASEVQAEIDRAFAEVGRHARLPGFRPGKAPRRVLERLFGDQVRREVLGKLVEASFHQAVDAHKLVVVGSPEIDAELLSPGEPFRYSATVDVRPEIVIEHLEGLEARRPSVVVSDADVDAVLASLREAVAQLRPVSDRAVVEAGDVVTVNLTTRLAEGDPVRREGVLLEAGAGTFPGALERQLVGQPRGACVSLEVTYPPDHPNAQLAGKTAAFEVEVLDIRVKDLPALDDDFARDHGRCDTLAELRERVRADLERQARERAEESVREQLLTQLAARHPFEVPQSLVQRRVETLLALGDVQVPAGVDRDAFLARLGTQLAPRAEREVRTELLLDAVAAREGIAPSDDEVTAEIEEMAARESQNSARVRALYDRPDLRQVLRTQLARRRALARLVERARIVPVTADTEVAPEDQSL